MTERARALQDIVAEAVSWLYALDDTLLTVKPSPDQWSIKEILGHLIDSAANNHQRFVRAQQEERLVFPRYEQEHWVAVQAYQEVAWPLLITFWEVYNQHLAHVIAHMPSQKLDHIVQVTPYEPVTLDFLITDYMVHLQHHLHQIRSLADAGDA